MLERLMNLLNSDVGPDLLRALKVVFLAVLAVATFGILYAPTVKPGKVTSYGLLRVLFAGALFAVLIYQATWQIWGYTNPDFVKFMRRYNRRPDAAEKQVMRGPLLDRRGMVLAAPVIGDVWGRRYPLGAAAAHPLGYYHSTYGITAVGACAIRPKRICDRQARRSTGQDVVHATRRRKAVTLTLDQRLQQKAYELLAGRKVLWWSCGRVAGAARTGQFAGLRSVESGRGDQG